eukprot:scaffold1325_cov138-Amphora_coffeaeformis.AAC.8
MEKLISLKNVLVAASPISYTIPFTLRTLAWVLISKNDGMAELRQMERQVTKQHPDSLIFIWPVPKWVYIHPNCVVVMTLQVYRAALTIRGSRPMDCHSVICLGMS